MFSLTLLVLLASFKIVYNDNGDSWEGDKVVWTKFNLIPKPILSNFTKSFHSVLKNSGFTTKAPRPVISVKLNQTKADVDLRGLRNVSDERERKVPIDSITLSSKIVGFPEDRTVPPKVVPVAMPTTTPPEADALARRRRRPVIRYEEEDDEDDDDDDDEEDITDQFDVEDDDDDDEEEEEEVEVVEEVPEPVDKHEYEG